MGTIRYWLFLFALSFNHIYSYQYDLSICAIFRDDARFLKEWIDYHKLVGVQHFYLFNNLSKDDFKSVLKPYIDSGDVTFFEWPYESYSGSEWDLIQRQAYEKGVELSIGVSKWLALIDTDEFIVPMLQNSLVEFLKDYEDYGGLGVNWMTFGTAGIQRIPEDKLMIETLLKRARDDEANHTTIKSIVQPERIQFPIYAVHYFSYQPGFWCVDADFRPIPREYSSTWKFDKIRLHHYRFRDKDFFFNVKIPRQAKYWSYQQGVSLEAVSNEVYDDTMLRFIPFFKHVQLF